MPESERKQGLWTTLPGFLTAVAALLTAVTGLPVTVYPHGVSGSKEGATAAVSPGTETARPAQAVTGKSSAAQAIMWGADYRRYGYWGVFDFG